MGELTGLPIRRHPVAIPEDRCLEPLRPEPQGMFEGLNFKPFTHKVVGCIGNIHPEKLTCPRKRDYFNRKYVFQLPTALIFVSFPGSKW